MTSSVVTPNWLPTVLLEPLAVGSVILPNRVMVSAHQTNFAQSGRVTDQLVDYLAARAAGGVGLIVTESLAVHPTSRHAHNVLEGWDDAIIPGLQRLADAIHQHPCRVFAQLLHAGRQQDPPAAIGGPVGPSPSADPSHRSVPHALTQQEIIGIVQSFVRAARRAGEAGLDGVEVHAGNGYLLQQFMSPWSNQRTDTYGGSVENRLRFTLEVLTQVRAAIGSSLALSVRLNVDEDVAGGLASDSLQDIAARIVAAGADLISLTAGQHLHPDLVIPPAGTPESPLAAASRALRAAVPVPVATSHRVLSAEHAERLLLEGSADLVNMARAHIADPDIVANARRGRAHRTRPCIGCLQGCTGRFGLGLPLGCLVNPNVGVEGVPPPRRSPRVRRVAVVGGGVAGLAAALVLRERGDDVTIFEQTEQLGGMLRTAAQLPTRHELGRFPIWQAEELGHLGATVLLSTTFATQRCADFDLIVVATGARRPRVGPPALGIEDGLARVATHGGRVVIIDRGDHKLVALLMAQAFLDAGAEVTVVADGTTVAGGLDRGNRAAINRRLAGRPLRLISFATIHSLEATSLVLDHEGWPLTIDDITCTVVVEQPVADATIADEIRRSHPDVPVAVVGDCYAPADAMQAVRHAAAVAATL